MDGTIFIKQWIPRRNWWCKQLILEATTPYHGLESCLPRVYPRRFLDLGQSHALARPMAAIDIGRFYN